MHSIQLYHPHPPDFFLRPHYHNSFGINEENCEYTTITPSRSPPQAGMDIDMLQEEKLSPQTERSPSPTLSQQHAAMASSPPSSQAVTPTPSACSPSVSAPEKVDHSAISTMDLDSNVDTALKDTTQSTNFVADSTDSALAVEGTSMNSPLQEDDGQVVADEVPTQPNQASSATEDDNGPDTTHSGNSHASWVGKAIDAVKGNKKNPLSDGDILIILDTKDLQRSCLVRSSDITKVSVTFNELFPNTKDHAKTFSSIPSAALVLSITEPMPELVPQPLHKPLETINSLVASEERKTRSQSAENARIKSESPQEEDASKSDPVDSGANWPKAYEGFFRIIAGKRAQGLSKSDPAAALPHIEAIVQVAQRYNAVHAVKGVFDSLFFEYVGNGTFWDLIHKEPARCINVAIILQKQHVYEEAFKHLVGRSANYEAVLQFGNLPNDVLAIVHRRSSELFNLRRKLNEDLLLMSLPVPKRKDGAPFPKRQSSVVNPHDHYDAYCTVNTFRDWICDHIAHLRNETSRPPSEEFQLCDHSNGCYTVAGFYRLLAVGGDAYLPADEVWEHVNSGFKRGYNNTSKNDMKNSLASLKNKASEVVAALVQSELHLPGKDELDYLTCVKVRTEDVPCVGHCVQGRGRR